MGFFGDMDSATIASLEAPPAASYGLPLGVNKDLVISKASIRTSDIRTDGTGGATGLEIEYSNAAGKSMLEWNNLPSATQTLEGRINSAKYLKARLLSLEIPLERHNSIEASELIGIELEAEVYEQKRKGSDFVNQRIKNIKRKGAMVLGTPRPTNVTVASSEIDPDF